MFILWHSKQEMCDKWGQSTSSIFIVSSDVRQGDILSPQLLAVFIDDLDIFKKNLKTMLFKKHY